MRVKLTVVIFTSITVAMGGCANMPTPVSKPYSFMQADGALAASWQGTIAPVPHKLTAYLTSPAGYNIAFQGSVKASIDASQEKPLLFSPGLYPFQLTQADNRTAELCGAMLVTDVNETVALATFGKTDSTKLFSPEMLNKARKGILTNYTIQMDQTRVIRYWLGNRTRPSAPGSPTIELDFSGTSDLSEIRVNGTRLKGALAVLNVYHLSYNLRTNTTTSSNATYRLEMVRKGQRYSGYIRDLRSNAYTTFVRLSCSLPDSLFTAADQGTVSKFTISPEEAQNMPVAEIIFGRGK